MFSIFVVMITEKPRRGLKTLPESGCCHEALSRLSNMFSNKESTSPEARSISSATIRPPRRPSPCQALSTLPSSHFHVPLAVGMKWPVTSAAVMSSLHMRRNAPPSTSPTLSPAKVLPVPGGPNKIKRSMPAARASLTSCQHCGSSRPCSLGLTVARVGLGIDGPFLVVLSSVGVTAMIGAVVVPSEITR